MQPLINQEKKLNSLDWNLFILVGHSGSGRTEAVRALEDMGIPGVDNLPPQLLYPFVDIWLKSRAGADKRSCVVALSIDGASNVADAMEAISRLESEHILFRLIAIEASESVAIKRIEDRWTNDGHTNIEKKLSQERLLVQPLVDKACEVLDTSHLSIPDLRERLGLIIKGVSIHRNFTFDFYSFGFKYGPFVPADIIFDVRFIANPYYVEELRDLNGIDELCSQYVMGQPNSEFFIKNLTEILTTLGPSYSRSGKSRLRIGIGCTGGQHRSVAIVEKLVKDIRLNGMHANAYHRELGIKNA
jgi:UPF0042 nucleotide-binding protein